METKGLMKTIKGLTIQISVQLFFLYLILFAYGRYGFERIIIVLMFSGIFMLGVLIREIKRP